MEATATVGVIQAAARIGDIEANIGTLDRLLSQAASLSADIVVTPELFVTGYHPPTAWLHDGQAIRARLAALARHHAVALVASTVDEECSGQAAPVRRISASFFSPSGEELARVHKCHLFGPQERQYFTPGQTYAPPVQWHGLRWGLGVCYDVEFPEFARIQAQQGAQALLVPTAVPELEDSGPAELNDATLSYSATLISTLQVPTRSLENGLYIAYANHSADGFTGLSCITTPTGRHATLLSRSEAGVGIAHVSSCAVDHARRLNTYLSDLQR